MSKADRTRQQILDAAENVLRAGESPSMGRIATAAGVTRQLLYVHFGGRANLLLEVSRRVDAAVRTPEQQAMVDGAPDGRAALRAAVALQGRIKPRIHPVASAIDHLRGTDPDADAAWQEREEARYSRAFAVVDRLAREGLLAAGWSRPTAARLLWSVTSQHSWADLVIEAGWTTSRWVRHTTQLLERSLLVPSLDSYP